MHYLLLLLILPAQIFGVTECEEYTQELLKQPSRPTMTQVAWLSQICDENPLANVNFTEHYVRLLKTDTRMAAAIAGFEKVMPGATLYPLGRDAVFVGDIMDGFYLSIGQEGRVKRLDASHPSFSHDDGLTYRFMLSNGIDVNKISQDYPHLMFDVTSFSQTAGVGGGASQSVRLIRAVYGQAFRMMGAEALPSLVRRINFVSIGGYFKARKDISEPSYDTEAFFARQSASVTAGGFLDPMFCDISGFTYTPAWHDIFQPFVEIRNRVEAPRGPLYSVGDRKHILAGQFELYRLVSHERFLNSVQVAALLQGFKFPLKRTENIYRYDEAARKILTERIHHTSARGVSPTPGREEPPTELAENWEVTLKHLYELSPAGANYLATFLRKRSAGEDPVGALAAIFDDFLTSTGHVTAVDVTALVRAALGSVTKKHNEALLDYLVDRASRIPLVKEAVRSAACGKPLLGDIASRHQKNYRDLLRRLGCAATIAAKNKRP